MGTLSRWAVAAVQVVSPYTAVLGSHEVAQLFAACLQFWNSMMRNCMIKKWMNTNMWFNEKYSIKSNSFSTAGTIWNSPGKSRPCTKLQQTKFLKKSRWCINSDHHWFTRVFQLQIPASNKFKCDNRRYCQITKALELGSNVSYWSMMWQLSPLLADYLHPMFIHVVLQFE